MGTRLSTPATKPVARAEWLRQNGWDFEGPIAHDGGDRSLYLSDPEGNRLELWDYLDGHRDIPG